MGDEMVVENMNKYLIKNNIFVRNVSDYGLSCHLRITIGRENKIVLFLKNKTIYEARWLSIDK